MKVVSLWKLNRINMKLNTTYAEAIGNEGFLSVFDVEWDTWEVFDFFRWMYQYGLLETIAQ